MDNSLQISRCWSVMPLPLIRPSLVFRLRVSTCLITSSVDKMLSTGDHFSYYMEARYKVPIGITINKNQFNKQDSAKKRRKHCTHTQLTVGRKILRSPDPGAIYSFYSPQNISHFNVKHIAYELLTFKLLYGQTFIVFCEVEDIFTRVITKASVSLVPMLKLNWTQSLSINPAYGSFPCWDFLGLLMCC